ncbi:MAG: glycosyltransferase [Thermoguttaceae bacterium]|jgi:glycosyltransferase involved in cell wall biosynthesis|nr:glycosyltransferase [Thermoguttaceae bacterium]
MKWQRSALIITRSFPPDASVGVHRVLGLCRHLAESGRWRVTVITAAPPEGAAVDEGLLAAVPEKVRVVRTAAPDLPRLAARVVKGRKRAKPSNDRGRPDAEPSETRAGAGPVLALPRRALRYAVDWTSWWLHVPDGKTGWLLPAVWAGWREARRERPDVIFTTAPVWTAHVAGAILSTMLRVRLVADFRDPWVGSAFRNVPYAPHRWLSAWLERRVVARAAHVTCAWDGIRRHLATRYPRYADKVTTILNGYDPDALEAAPARRPDLPGRVFVHAGGFYGPRSPLPLLEALRRLQAGGNGLAGKAAFLLAGPGEYKGRALADLAAEYGAANLVHGHPRVPHREALGLIKGADAAMLFGQSGSEALATIPAKAYEYIGLRKPVLAIGAGREVCNVMRRGGCPVWSAPADDPAALAAAIDHVLRYLAGAEPPPEPVPEKPEDLTRKRMAEEIEKVLGARCQKLGAGS